MKESKYNVDFEYKGFKYIYNSMSNAFARTDDEFDQILNEIKYKGSFSDLDNKTYKQMISANIIVEDDVDELNKYESLLEKAKADDTSCQFTIAPSLNCNCRCYYCYENRTYEKLDDELVNKTIDFIKKSIQGKKACLITWYGGEPLLCKDIVYKISEDIINFCNTNNIYYEANMITNGVLLDNKTIKKLKEYKVKTMQITLDGCKEQHDKKRILANGSGTYDVILKSIKLVDKSNIKLSIRINTDKETEKGIESVLNDLKQLKLKNSSIYFGLLGTPTEYCSSISGSCLTNENYAIKNLEWFSLMEKEGLIDTLVKFYPKQIVAPCKAVSKYSCVIDSKGNLYKCYDDIGNEKMTIGNITRFDSLPILNNPNADKYLCWKATTFKECQSCKLLPICGGFCPFFSMKDKRTVCIKWKYILIDYLKKVIDSKYYKN